VGIQCSQMKWCHECWNSDTDLTYCMNCHGSKKLFGCIGLRSAQYCVFNTQYTKEEYEKLVGEIRKQMESMPYVDPQRKRYAYGEFYPPEFSPFAYNETVAQDFFPKTESECASFGYPWRKEEEKRYEPSVKSEDIPNTIESVDETICNEVLECFNKGKIETKCTSAFKIHPEELKFYKRFSLPLPQYCFNCRTHARIMLRNPLKLWHRACMCENSAHSHGNKCPNQFETSYAPDRREIVYCESCYQKEVV